MVGATEASTTTNSCPGFSVLTSECRSTKPVITLTVNTIPVECLVDTGSCVTLMRKDIFDKLCTLMKRSLLLNEGPKLHSVDGSPIVVHGVTEWKFDNLAKCDLIIVDRMVQDCILGMDFLREANGNFNMATNKVTLCDLDYICNAVNISDNSFVPDIIQSTILNNGDIFSTETYKLGCCEIEPCTINTEDNLPIKQRPYRLPLNKRLIVEAEIQQMTEAGVIRPSSSPWASPVVLVPKKDGSTRFCLDFRKLNNVTCSDSYSLPSIQEIFDSMYGAQIFSTIDLTSGYWQIPMHPDSIAKTAFCTHMGND